MADWRVFFQSSDSPANLSCVRVGLKTEAEGTLPKHNDICVERFVLDAVIFFDNGEGSETGKVVRREELNLLASFLGNDILNCERVDTERLADALHFFLSGRVDVQPPNTVFFLIRQLEKPTEIFTWKHKIAEIRSVDS
ncbi:hypothetical protein HG531_007320 [Fusarium graminearum]|nr:hypothetical protein HG531_007320 [Fusarium graminearum]